MARLRQEHLMVARAMVDRDVPVRQVARSPNGPRPTQSVTGGEVPGGRNSTVVPTASPPARPRTVPRGCWLVGSGTRWLGDCAPTRLPVLASRRRG